MRVVTSILVAISIITAPTLTSVTTASASDIMPDTVSGTYLVWAKKQVNVYESGDLPGGFSVAAAVSVWNGASGTNFFVYSGSRAWSDCPSTQVCGFIRGANLGATNHRTHATYASSNSKIILALVTVNTYYSWASAHLKAVGDCQAVGKVDLTYLRAYNTTGSCMVDDPWQSYTAENPSAADASYIRTAQGLSG